MQLVDRSTGRPVGAQTGDGKVPGLKVARADLAGFMLEEAVTPRQMRTMPLVYA